MAPQQPLRIPSITGLPLRGPVRAVWVLMALNALLYLAAQGLSFWLANDPFCRPAPYACALLYLGWKDNLLIFTQGEYWRLLTAMFLHSGLSHLFANSFGLLVLGPDSERIFGWPRFLALYLLAGLSGGVLSYAFSAAPSVGASGAVFGLMGGLLVFFYSVRTLLGDFGTQQLRGLAAFVVIGFVFGLMDSGVDNFGHLGGLLGGALVGWVLVPRFQRQIDILEADSSPYTRPRDWLGAAGILAVLVVLALLIRPPLA